ncbi:MAG: T9SS type A sorting domain-containing protein [Flavobacteriales bacterium]|nr:T9SS type A sorting domain-containing protein [Bacteroidota bacterium]MCB9240151.1 T9SS type A sorting domain-containing protein [Flavobacteriales bacterium]
MMTLSRYFKSLLLSFIALFLISNPLSAQVNGIWTGAKKTFTKANYADYTKPANQDRITDTVWITRKTDQGIFNIKTSTGYATNSSPRDTKWAFGTTSNISSLNFRDWQSAVGSNPPGMVNRDMVVFLVSDSIYIDIKFTSWTQGGAGGGFSYTRSTDCRSFVTKKVAGCDSFVSPTNKVWYTSGVYMDTLTNSAGCDSIMELHVTVMGPDTTGKVSISGCGSVLLPLSKTKVTKTAVYMDTLLNGTICGRDSILTVNVYIYPIPTKTINASACDSFKSPSGKYVWKTSGQYTDILQAFGTCDTVATVNLTINKSVVTKVKESACNTYTSVTGKVYTVTGNYFDTLQTQTGCDSVIDLDLTVHKSSLNKVTKSACTVSYLSPSGKYRWTSPGKYYDTLMSKAGCDSVLEIFLVLDPYKTSQTIKSCAPMVSPSGKYTYDVTGVYEDTVKTKTACDSLVTTNFTRTYPSTASITIPAALNRYISPSKRHVWTTTGVYNDTIPNKAGCDSVMTFDVTIQPISLDVTRDQNVLTAVATGVKYQWLDCDKNYAILGGKTQQSYTVTKTGTYAVRLSNDYNSDTSACYTINLGVNDLNEYGVRVFPNPTDGVFQIDLSKAYPDIQRIQVFNSLGAQIQDVAVQSAEQQLDLTEQAPGAYFIVLTGDKLTLNTSVVVR